MTLMTKTTKGHIITQNLDGTDHLDCLYRISLKALIYNDVGQILVVKEIDRLRYQLFDASDEIYVERIDANQICFSCRVWTENFDFSAGVDADEVMFMDPEELRIQESESGAPLRYNVHLKWQKLCSANSLPTE